jgi:hypothetical protein
MVGAGGGTRMAVGNNGRRRLYNGRVNVSGVSSLIKLGVLYKLRQNYTSEF